MRELSFTDAVTEALFAAMSEDSKVLAFECTFERNTPTATWSKLIDTFSPQRARSVNGYTSAVIGTALGMTIAGLRPIVRLDSPAQILSAYQFLFDAVSKLPQISGGNLNSPLIITAPSGAGTPYGPQHDVAIDTLTAIIPNLSVVVPSNAYEAKGLLCASFQEDHPVLILESPLLYDSLADTPQESYSLPLEETTVLRSGHDLTLIAWGHHVRRACYIADRLNSENIKCDVLNLRSLAPLDLDTITLSVEKTHRVAIIDDGPTQAGFGTILAAIIQRELFSHLKSPIKVISFWEELPRYLPKIKEYDTAFTHRCLTELVEERNKRQV
ncbi:MAG: alpha-ketoacid dehydrogenase subunit beta [Bdellovibrionota bacterium]|jgi:pyruvate/2-oxoglutarate/acetoin dehydrogenase E1 component